MTIVANLNHHPSEGLLGELICCGVIYAGKAEFEQSGYSNITVVAEITMPHGLGTFRVYGTKEIR